MELAREIFHGGDEPWSWAIDGVADVRKVMIAYGMKQAPTRKG